MPIVRSDQRHRLVGTVIVFDSLAALNAAVAVERANIAAGGSAFWPEGQPLIVAPEASLGLRRTWTRTGGGSARSFVIRPGLTVQLGADASAVLGAPSGGADGDLAVDFAANAFYIRVSGAWSAPQAIYPTGSGSLPYVEATLTAQAPSALAAVVATGAAARLMLRVTHPGGVAIADVLATADASGLAVAVTSSSALDGVIDFVSSPVSGGHQLSVQGALFPAAIKALRIDL